MSTAEEVGVEMSRLIKVCAIPIVMIAATQSFAQSSGDLWRDLGLTRPNISGRAPERPAEDVPRTRSEADTRSTDARAAERQRQQDAIRIQKINTAWLPVTEPAIVITRERTVTITPASGLFRTPPSRPQSFVEPLGRIAMKETPVASEGLRRALTILRIAASQSLSNEEAAFLAGQAGLAMEGAPLQVLVPQGAQEFASIAETLRSLTVELSREQATVDRARRERAEVVAAYNNLKNSLSPANVVAKQRAELEEKYARASLELDVAQKRTQEIKRQVQIIIIK